MLAIIRSLSPTGRPRYAVYRGDDLIAVYSTRTEAEWLVQRMQHGSATERALTELTPVGWDYL